MEASKGSDPFAMPRPHRIAYDGAIYHTTIHGNNEEVTFRDEQDYDTYLEQLTQMISRHAIVLLAYGLMTNHIHMVLRTPRANISRALQWLHSCYAARFNRRHRRRGHLFGDRFYSSIVDTDEYLLEVTRYIHRNPVRAGLVPSAEEYQWSSYAQYLGEREGRVPVDPSCVLWLVSEDPQRCRLLYRRFVEDGLTAQWAPPRQENLKRVAVAAAAACDAAGILFATLHQSPRNRDRALIMGVLRGVEGLSTVEIAQHFGVPPKIVTMAAWRLACRASSDPEAARWVSIIRGAAMATLKN